MEYMTVFKKSGSLPITQAEYIQVTPRTKVGMSDDKAKSFSIQVYLSSDEIAEFEYRGATEHNVPSNQLKWPSDIDVIIQEFRRKKHMLRPMSAILYGFIGSYPNVLDTIPDTPYNKRLVRILTNEKGKKVFYDAQRPENADIILKEFKKNMNRAMEKVPKYEGFTRKDLEKAPNMPLPRSPVHLD